MDKDEKKLKNEVTLGSESYKIVEKTEFDDFLISLPQEPDKGAIKRLLIELPSQLLYLQNKTIEFKKQIGDTKVLVKTKKTLLEYEKSDIRKRELDDYVSKLKEFQKKSEEILRTTLESKENASLKKLYAQEMLKVYTPQKPTRADLEDIANVETYHLQKEIDQLEENIKDYVLELDIINTKKDFYDNMWVTIRAYKGILIEEMRALGEGK